MSCVGFVFRLSTTKKFEFIQKDLFGGLKRSDKPVRTQLAHGDVVVWGNASRLAYHGIDKLKEGQHEFTGAYRYNLTFRSEKIIENLK